MPRVANTPRVGDLRIFAGESTVGLPATSTRYNIIEAAIHLALCILESSQGRQSLVQTAQAIITESRTLERPHIYRDSLENMPNWVNRFLVRVREDFFTVYVADIGGEAQAQRLEWAKPGKYDMNRYVAGPAGDLYVNRVLVENMVNAHKQQPRDTYSRFKFQMGISIAHEIVHFLTGFLVGSPRSNTPRRVTLEGWGNTRTGEAGRYWEGALLGGVVEFRSDSEDSLGVRQAGVPYLFPTGRSEAPGRRISQAYINEFVDGVFSFPVLTLASPAETTRRNLDLSTLDTTDLRSGRRRQGREAVESPPPDQWSMRYRMPASGYARAPSQSAASQGVGSGRGYAPQPARPSQAFNPPAGGSGRAYSSQTREPGRSSYPQPAASDRPYSSQPRGPAQPLDPRPPGPFDPRPVAAGQPSYTQPASGSRPQDYYYRR